MVSKNKIPPIFASLAQVLEGEMSMYTEALRAFAKDSSPLFIEPQAVIFPKNTKDLRLISLFAKQYGFPIAVRGSGLSSSGGSLTEGLVLDMRTHFTKVKRLDFIKNTVTAEPGATIKELLEKIRDDRVTVPIFTKEEYLFSVGGVVAENTVTSTSQKYGDVRSWIEEVTILLPNGEEHKISDGMSPSGELLAIYEHLHALLYEHKETVRTLSQGVGSSGYNVSTQGVGLRQVLDLIVGSEGTLGVITSVTFRTAPILPHKETLLSFVNSLEEARLTISYAKDAHSVRLFDLSFLRHIHKNGLPSALLTEEKPYVLVAMYEGIDKKSIDLAIAHHEEKNRKNKIHSLREKNIDTYEKLCTLEKEACRMYAEQTRSLHATLLDRVSVPKEKLLAVLSKIMEDLDRHDIAHSVSGLLGIAAPSITFFLAHKEDDASVTLHNIMRYASKHVREAGGSLVHGNGDGLVRTPYTDTFLKSGPKILTEAIQKLFDKEQIYNTGKKTFIGSAYTGSRIDKNLTQ